MRLLIISAVALMVAILFIASPGAAYFSSGEADFPLTLITYLSPLIAGSAALVVSAVLLAWLLPVQARKPVAIGLVFLALMVVVETFLLIPNFGAFTGAAVDFSSSWGRYLFEIGAVILALVMAREWAKHPAVPAGILIAGAAFFSIPTIWSAMNEAKAAPEKLDDTNLFSMGEKNVLVVLLDGFPSDVFEEIVEADTAWGDKLSGFTYYPDTVGVSPTTFLALPSIHSGEVYTPGEKLQPFFTTAVRDNSFMKGLADAGYSSVLVNPMNGVCPAGTDCVPAGITLGDQASVGKMGAARLLGVSLFKAAPLALKERVYDEGRWLIPPMVAEDWTTDHNVEGVETLSLYAERLASGSSQPTVKFIHVLTPHLPVVYGEGCIYSGETIPATREAFLTQSSCALGAFGKMIDALQEKGLYDQTAIVLLSDHGQALPSRKADIPGDWQKLSGWANPLLVVKPINASGPMVTSREPRWTPQIPGIVCGLTGDCEAKSAPATNIRGFNYYEWKNEFWRAESIPVTQYKVTGSPWLAGSWQRIE